MGKAHYKDLTEKDRDMTAFIQKFIIDNTGRTNNAGMPWINTLQLHKEINEITIQSDKYTRFLEGNYGNDFPPLVKCEMEEVLSDAVSERQTLGEDHVAKCKRIVCEMEYEAKQRSQNTKQWKLTFRWGIVLALVSAISVIVGALFGPLVSNYFLN